MPRIGLDDAVPVSDFVDIERARAVSQAERGEGSNTHKATWRGVGLKVQLGHMRGISGKKLDKILPFHFQCPPMEQETLPPLSI